MTADQLSILRHALGLRTDGSGRSYRNRFVTGPGSSDYDNCMELVSEGCMVRQPGNALTGGDDLFQVTPYGRFNAVLRQTFARPEEDR